MKKMIVWAQCALLAAVGLATDYEWVGGTDLDWTTSANWNPSTGYPNGASDVAKFKVSPSGTVVVSSDITVLQVIADAATVTIGGTGSLMTPNATSAFYASNGAVLSFEVPLRGSNRVNISGTGSIVFDSAIANTMDSANSCCYIYALTNVFGAQANVTTKSPICFGLGAQSYVSRSFIRDGAVLAVHDLYFAAGSSSCSETRVVQEGGSVTTAGTFDLNKTGTAAKQYYTIDGGALTSTTFCVSSASGGGEFSGRVEGRGGFRLHGDE